MADHRRVDADSQPSKRRCLGGIEPLPFSCRAVVAPMVGCSDLAWRLLCRRVCPAECDSGLPGWVSCNECRSPRLTCALPCRARRHLLPCLCRRHGADLCYTEMLFADRFVAEPEYRERKLRTCAEDAPLVVQFCGNEPATLAAAARLVRG